MPCSLPFRRPTDDRLDEEALCKRSLQFGYDGSIVGDGRPCTGYVYVVGEEERQGVQEIDYITGYHSMFQTPMALMVNDNYVPTKMMCNTRFGHIAFCVRKIQRLWRWRRSERYGRNMIQFGMAIAQCCLRATAMKRASLGPWPAGFGLLCTSTASEHIYVHV